MADQSFLAKTNIPWGGVNAYTRGQRVEADVVEEQGWQDLVVGENTKEGRELKAAVSGQPLESFETAKTESKSGSRAAAKNTEQEG